MSFKYLFLLLTSFFVFHIGVPVSANDCECPEVKCTHPCEDQTGITFYTEKCDAGKKVKSCAKPTCTPQENPSELCLAHRKSQQQNRGIASGSSVKSERIEESTNLYRPVVGQVEYIKGKAWIKSDGGHQRDIVVKMNLREDEIIMTSSNGRVRVKLSSGNTLNVMPDSMLKLTEMNIEQKKTIIDLLKGRVRSKVTNRLNGENEYFKLRTRSAIAGVRGTDFIVSYEMTQKSITKVQTLEGSVELVSGDRKQKQIVLGGQEASFVVAANSSDIFSDEEINSFVARGYMTPVYKMTSAEVKSLDWGTRAENVEEVTRAVASKKGPKSVICSSPEGQLNQCYWKCENNPKDESRCRTDLPQVNCVRRLCNANGEWADEMRLPATFFEKCDPKQIKVGPCDY